MSWPLKCDDDAVEDVDDADDDVDERCSDAGDAEPGGDALRGNVWKLDRLRGFQSSVCAEKIIENH